MTAVFDVKSIQLFLHTPNISFSPVPSTNLQIFGEGQALGEEVLTKLDDQTHQVSHTVTRMSRRGHEGDVSAGEIGNVEYSIVILKLNRYLNGYLHLY